MGSRVLCSRVTKVIQYCLESLTESHSGQSQGVDIKAVRRGAMTVASGTGEQPYHSKVPFMYINTKPRQRSTLSQSVLALAKAFLIQNSI